MDNLSKLIKSKGFTVYEFCRELGMKYRTFRHQVDEKTMRYRDIRRVLDLLGDVTFEDLHTEDDIIGGLQEVADPTRKKKKIGAPAIKVSDLLYPGQKKPRKYRGKPKRKNLRD